MADLKIKFLHMRFHNGLGGVSAKGGTTVAYVIDEHYKVLGFAKAKCHANDPYVKQVGRDKAKGRLKSLRYYQDVPAMDEQQFIEAMYASN